MFCNNVFVIIPHQTLSNFFNCTCSKHDNNNINNVYLKSNINPKVRWTVHYEHNTYQYKTM